MTIVSEILGRVDLTEPDERPLYAYEITTSEQKELAELLRRQIRMTGFVASLASGFVIWASEHIRTQFPGGHLTWEFVFKELGSDYEREAAVRLTKMGLNFWKRPLQSSNAGHKAYLFSLLAEGGLPDLALAEEAHYLKVLLHLIREIEIEGPLGHAIANAAARRAVTKLPQVMRSKEQAQLLADLALVIVVARSWLPEDIKFEETETWLDKNHASWRQRLPFRLSECALSALIRPALAAERIRPKSSGALVERQLHRSFSGSEWNGVAIIVEGSKLLHSMLPSQDQQVRMRLLAGDDSVFLATPVEDGWILSRSTSRGKVELACAPDEAVILSVYIDGKSEGEVVLDPGFPPPEVGSSLWHPKDISATEPDVLVPLSGRGQTRATHAFALGPEEAVPESVSGIGIGKPQIAPGGLLWPLSGRGKLRFGKQELGITTEADADAPTARLMVSGKSLTRFFGREKLQIFVGQPVALGAEGDQPLAVLGRTAAWRELPGLLGGMIVEWCEDGDVLARLRLVVLPKIFQLNLSESKGGRLQLRASGVPADWHLHLAAGDGFTQDRSVGPEIMLLELESTEPLDKIELRLKDPKSDASLELSSFCTVSEAVLISPEGKLLAGNRKISVKSLFGWRGSLPEFGGAMQLNLSTRRAPVTFSVGGPIRLTAYLDLIEQALALMNSDGRVNLELVGGGRETPRLEIGRSDWDSEEAAPFWNFGHGVTRLQAVCLDNPTSTVSFKAEGNVDLANDLDEDEGLWFVQGHHPTCGAMRPFVWSARPQSRSSRDARVKKFVTEWQRLTETPNDPGWTTSWDMIEAVRSAGDASALDNVLALAKVPVAAAALVMRAPRCSQSTALGLEAETPLWWPLVSCSDWERAMTVQREHLRHDLHALGRSGEDVLDPVENVHDSIVLSAMKIFTQRPELAAHLGFALAAMEVGKDVIERNGASALALVPASVARELLIMRAREADRRCEELPQGVGGLRPVKLTDDFGLRETFKPLLWAPMVVAEVATNLRKMPEAHEILQLLALRNADSLWFDFALPVAVTLAMEIKQ